ncbi:Internal alternative NAD(P)H-ubiquinone oxidoreductase A1 mitochondrial [Bienertia sinuspersici]
MENERHLFKVAYDKLVIAVGADPLTFNITGVKEHATFLREVNHAQEIRKKLLSNIMFSQSPGISDEERRRLLHCVVVGGGPTGVEFSGELSDFIKGDVKQRYAHVKDHIKVTLIEANELLSSFDVGLRDYAVNQLKKSGVCLKRGIVKVVEKEKIILTDGTQIPYGILVWSTGVGPSQFVKSLNLPKCPAGRIGIDQWLRVPTVEDVFALGDCAGFLQQTGRNVLPALAQVAESQGKYLVELFNNMGKQNAGKAFSAKHVALGEPFVYKHAGSLASVGSYKALVDLRKSKDAKGISIAGFFSFLIWRSTYLMRVLSWRNKFYVAANWATTLVFGRDISKI